MFNSEKSLDREISKLKSLMYLSEDKNVVVDYNDSTNQYSFNIYSVPFGEEFIEKVIKTHGKYEVKGALVALTLNSIFSSSLDSIRLKYVIIENLDKSCQEELYINNPRVDSQLSEEDEVDILSDLNKILKEYSSKEEYEITRLENISWNFGAEPLNELELKLSSFYMHCPVITHKYVNFLLNVGEKYGLDFKIFNCKPSEHGVSKYGLARLNNDIGLTVSEGRNYHELTIFSNDSEKLAQHDSTLPRLVKPGFRAYNKVELTSESLKQDLIAGRTKEITFHVETTLDLLKGIELIIHSI